MLGVSDDILGEKIVAIVTTREEGEFGVFGFVFMCLFLCLCLL